MIGSHTLSRGLDYLGDLGAKLRDLQGFQTLAHELIQNADDAKTATSISFDIGQDALVVDNDGMFSNCGDVESHQCPWQTDDVHKHRCDFHRFRYVAAGDKRAEEGTTGAFGIGFITVYQITDAPELISAGRHWVLRETNPEDQRILVCGGCAKCTDAELPGTRFILPWAWDPNSDLRRALRADAVAPEALQKILQEFQNDAPVAMLFLKRLREISIKQEGRIIKTWERVDDERSLILTDGRPENDRVWHIIKGQFLSAAQRLRQTHPNRIEEKRSCDVSLAIANTDLGAGLLCACLPTEHDLNLPFHINADFFPSNDRKRVIFEQDYQSEWNREALRAAAAALANALPDLPKLVDCKRLWSIISRLKQIAESSRPDQPELREFWLQTSSHLRTAPVVFTSDARWELPRNASLLSQKEESSAIPLLEKLGISIVHEDLRSFQTNLRADADVRLLDIEMIAEALKSAGLTRRTEFHKLPAFLRTAASRQVLWDEIDLLLERQQRTPKAKADDERRLHEIALAPGRDGALWPCREIYSADAETVELFGSLRLPVAFLAENDGFAALKYLCPSFNARAAIELLERIDSNSIEQLWKNNKLPLPRLFEWFENRRQEILSNPELKHRLAALTLFPGNGQLLPLDRFALPGDFRDPLALADVVDVDAVGGRREFLRDLGMPEMSFSTYAVLKIPTVLARKTLPADKLRELTILLSRYLGELKGNDEAQAGLAKTAIVECKDGVIRRPSECHFESESVRECLAESAHIAVLPSGHETRVQDFYGWLGVSHIPRVSSIVARVHDLSDRPYSNSIAKELQKICAYLGENIREPNEVPQLDALRDRKCLPARGRSDRWYAAGELYAAYQDYLFDSQALFIDLARNVQTASRNFLEFLGVGIAPSPGMVVKHLVHCAAQHVPVNTEVYRFLNDNADDVSLSGLLGKKCLWLAGTYYAAIEVYWGEHPFGRYRKRLGDELRIYSGLLKRLNVRESPNWEDALMVVAEISNEFGRNNSPLDEEACAVLMTCWRSIGEALDSGGVPIEAISKLRSVKCVPGVSRTLHLPEWIFFDNRSGLAAKFGSFLVNNVVARPIGTGRALDVAGVRGLRTAVQLDLLECGDPVDDPVLAERLCSRRNEIGRVFESAGPNFDNVTSIRRIASIQCQVSDSIKIRYRLHAFNRDLVSDEEQVPAVYIPDQSLILYALRNGEVPWAAIARELSSAFFPDEDPGRFAAGLKEVLAAKSVEQAAGILDELGFAKLDTSFVEPIAEGQIVETLGASTPVEDWIPAPELPAHETVNEQLTPAEAVELLLGKNIAPPTPPIVSADPEIVGTNGSSRTSSNRRSGRPVLRSYLPSPVGSTADSNVRTKSEHNVRSAVDEAGIRRVMEFETLAGRFPKEMPHTNEGYDIESSDNSGKIVRYIEVKSFSGAWKNTYAVLSRPQFTFEWNDRADLFWLYVVERAQTDFQIYRIANPALKANHFMFDDGWRSLAEVEAQERGIDLE